jgi:YHS domain-containing protein
MRGLIIINLLLAFLFLSAGPVPAAETVKAQTKCPLTGEPINKKYYADFEGKRVYFCCPACIEKFKADPAGYIKKMEDQGITLAKAPKLQTVCPVAGGPIDKKVFTDYKGQRVYFCCADCQAKFKADPEKYMKKMKDEGVELEKAPAPKK